MALPVAVPVMATAPVAVADTMAPSTITPGAATARAAAGAGDCHAAAGCTHGGQGAGDVDAIVVFFPALPPVPLMETFPVPVAVTKAPFSMSTPKPWIPAPPLPVMVTPPPDALTMALLPVM